MNANQTAETLAETAMLLVFKGAQVYLRSKNLTASASSLAECCKSWAKIKLPEAMADAKEAFECNMHQVGVATFSATMIQAGIEAAKECGMPAEMAVAS